MSNNKKAFEDGVSELYDLAWSQFKEDREAIMSLYKDLKDLTVGNPERYAVLGESLAKYAELMTKQTAQVIELLKVTQKNKEKEENLSMEELEEIHREINKQ